MSEPTILENGRIYFKHCLGAVYELYPAVGEPFSYRVIDCEYDEEEQYYRIESAGKELPTRFTLDQLDFMLSRLPCEQTEEGEAVELPLTVEEVRAFYFAEYRERNKANAAENLKLKGTAYKSNVTLIKNLNDSLRLYKASGDVEKVAETEKKLAELETEQTKILNDKKVDVNILRKKTDCTVCNDTGIVDGKPCACALARAETIKAFNAELRLNRRNAAQ